MVHAHEQTSFSNPFQSGIHALQENPIGNDLCAAPVAKAADLRKIAARDSYSSPSDGAKFGIIPWYPGFDHPRLTTNARVQRR
jgi:hypothetical protein